jgi:hypothetical protein
MAGILITGDRGLLFQSARKICRTTPSHLHKSDFQQEVANTETRLVAYYLPLGNPKVTSAILEAFRLLQWYAIHWFGAQPAPHVHLVLPQGIFAKTGRRRRDVSWKGSNFDKMLLFGMNGRRPNDRLVESDETTTIANRESQKVYIG